MSNLSQFTNKENVSLLWDILLDELHINTNNKPLTSNVRTVFDSNIKPFTATSNPKTNIMELNKQFLSQVVLAINRLFPNLQKQYQNIKRITITNEEASVPYKIEDIHSSRQTEFEKAVEKKRADLENYMSPPLPKELDFSYGNLDGKITAMDSLVAEKMAQRNLDIEQLQSGNYNQTNFDPETWLKSKETSVKNEKNGSLSTQTINNRLKRINIDGDNISLNQDLNNNKNQKKVSFSDSSNENSSVNIFQKLKRHPQPLEEIMETDIVEQKQYIEQKSQPLPEIHQEQINRGSVVQQTISNPIIPKNEMIKQLNDMNKKIDNLYEMVFKLTNSMQELISNKPNNPSENNLL